MSVSFRILPEHGLVYVRYEGTVQLEDSFAAFAEYARHPDRRPGQKHLVDMSGVTAFDRDFTALMKLQAHKADVFMQGDAQTMIVYYAPTRATYAMARQVIRSWEAISSVVVVVQQNEADALALLGLRDTSISSLLQAAG